METKKILIVDDEQDLCEILRYNLTAAGFEVESAYSAEEAMALVHGSQSTVHGSQFFASKASKLEHTVHGFDLLLLDVMLSGMSGFELARRLKEDETSASVPIIFLTAKDREEDMLEGFGLGADDYIKKPFSVREVVARVKAVLKRGGSPLTLPKEGSAIRFEGLELDVSQKTATVDDERVNLTKTEFELLGLLMGHPGVVFSRKHIFDAVWPEDVVVSDRTVDVNIARLRKKIGRYSECIVARQGFGYVFSGW